MGCLEFLWFAHNTSEQKTTPDNTLNESCKKYVGEIAQNDLQNHATIRNGDEQWKELEEIDQEVFTKAKNAMKEEEKGYLRMVQNGGGYDRVKK